LNLKRLLQRSSDGGKCLYLTESLENEITEKTDIILSPHFYWIKTEEFPVKSPKDAYKFAPSLFDSLIKDLSGFKFKVLKSDIEGKFIFIAYSPSEIYRKLTEKYGVKDEFISSLYFAQSEFNTILEPLSVNRNLMLVRIDGVVSEIRNSSQQDQTPAYVTAYIRKNSRTREKINLSGVKGGLTQTQQIVVLSAPLLLSILLFLQNLSLQDELDRIDSRGDEIREKYNLPATSFELKSIVERLQKIDGEQSRFRKDLLWLDSKNLKRYGKVEELILDSKVLSVKFRLKKGSNSRAVKMIFQKRSREADITQSENILMVSIKR
jgi:hypothetical protein